MPIVWTESLTLRLVTLYSQYECLRNPFHPNFTNKLCRYKAYKEIVDFMNVCGLTVCDCIKRITNIKAQYCYELSKISAAISREKIYKPPARWFPIIHKLFFPFVTSYTCAKDFYKMSNDEADSCKDYQCSETYPDSTNLIVPSREECYCAYMTCDFGEPYKTKPRTRHKTPYTQTKGVECFTSGRTATDGRSYLEFRPQKVTRIDVGNNTRRNISGVHATQTDVSYFKTACTTCQVCMENETMKNEPEDVSCTDSFQTDEDVKRKRKAHDEFDIFGKSIAFQLRNINFEIAIKLEKRIQNLIAQERLDNMKLKSFDCGSACSSSQGKIMHKDMVCSCGLPVIMIKADSSCDLEFKHRI